MEFVRLTCRFACMLFTLSITLQQHALVKCCSFPQGYYPPSDEEVVFRAPQVIFGRVRQTYPSVPPREWYTAHVDVYCTMKGPRTPASINVTYVGFIPGMCYGTQLVPELTYVIVTDSVNRNEFRAFRTFEADFTKLTQLIRACGLQRQYPYNIENSPEQYICPEPSPAGECLDQNYFDSLRPKPPVRPPPPHAAANRVRPSKRRYVPFRSRQ